VLRADVEIEHAADDDAMVAGLVHGLEVAVDPGDRAVGFLGDPDGAGRQARSVKGFSAFDANLRQMLSSPAPRTFTENARASLIFGQLVELLSGRNDTSEGGGTRR
jgi:hypothetical protein